MPQQPPDILVNEYPSVDFGALRLYTIVQGQRPARPRWNNQYPFKHRPRPSNHAVCSKLWRGYLRSEERRVGKECRCRWSAYHEKKKEVEVCASRRTES